MSSWNLPVGLFPQAPDSFVLVEFKSLCSAFRIKEVAQPQWQMHLPHYLHHVVVFLPFICSKTQTPVAYNPQGSAVNVSDDLWLPSTEEFTSYSMTKCSMLSVDFRCLA